MFSHPTIKVVSRKSRVNSRNEVPLYLQLTLNRKVNKLSLNMYVPLSSIEMSRDGVFMAEKSKYKYPNAKETNYYLSQLINRAKKIILDFQNNHQPISFQKFKDEFLGIRSDDFYKLHDKVFQLKEQRGIAPRTLKGYQKEYRRLKSFRDPLYFKDIDHQFLDAYAIHLKKERGNDVNTIWKSLCYIRMMLYEALRMELIDRTPFTTYELKYIDKKKDHLSYIELNRLYDLFVQQSISPVLHNVLSYFLFSCYTGLDFGDIKSLRYNDIMFEDNRYLIDRCRAKNGHHYTVPLAQRAVALLNPKMLKLPSDQLVFRVISNQKTNSFLKEIINIANIHKRITFHSARHTFGTLSLNLTIPREVVQKMMGHQTIQMTSHYAKVLNQYASREMDKWDAKENEIKNT